jgi:hypothetical protein
MKSISGSGQNLTKKLRTAQNEPLKDEKKCIISFNQKIKSS